MLAVGARLAPDRPGRSAVVDGGAVPECDVLAVDSPWSSCWRCAGRRFEILVVGQHGDRLGIAEEIVVMPEGRAGPSAPAGCGSKRRGAEMLVDLHRKPASMAREAVAAPTAIISRQADGGVTSNSGRRPSPRSRTCWRSSMPNFATSCALVDTATKCLAVAALSPLERRLEASRARCARWSWSRAW